MRYNLLLKSIGKVAKVYTSYWAVQNIWPPLYFNFANLRVRIIPFFRSDISAEEYVYNPINAFHMIVRNAIWLPRLFPNDTSYNILSSDTNKIMQVTS